jgi:hypothetical protein
VLKNPLAGKILGISLQNDGAPFFRARKRFSAMEKPSNV